MPKSDDDHKVGYGSPPKATQFKKGQRSANPRGRPPALTSNGALLDKILNEKVQVVRDGRKAKITRLELYLRTLVTSATNGDPRASRTLATLIREQKQGKSLGKQVVEFCLVHGEEGTLLAAPTEEPEE